MARRIEPPSCLGGPAWLPPPTNPALARPWDRQTGSLAHRSQAPVGSAMGCRRPLAHRPLAARQIRPGLRPLSPNSLPCTHLTLGYSLKLVEKLSEKSLTRLRPSLTNSRTGPIRLLFPPYAGQTRSRRAARTPFIGFSEVLS